MPPQIAPVLPIEGIGVLPSLTLPPTSTAAKEQFERKRYYFLLPSPP